ncbi:MAG: hypothetical protein ACLQQ4_10870 [Bacteroidia bacterium]
MKPFLIPIAVFLLCSCGTGLKINKSEFKAIDRDFSGTFLSQPYKSSGSYSFTSEKMYAQTLPQLFGISHSDESHSFSFKINTSGQLQVTFADSGGNYTEKLFDGILTKKGYYEIYLRNKNMEFPPFFPVVYNQCDIDRIRIALTKSNDLIVDNLWENDDSILLFFGTGDSGRSQNYFKATTATH